MGKEWDKLDWQAGGGFSKPGIGDRHTNWPSFSATSKYGATNPTCAECGGRLRGAKKCGCVMPHDHWKPIGKRKNPENEGLPDNVTGSGMSSQMVAIQAWHEAWLHACFRVLVPGGRLLAFGGSRVYHRMAAAFDDAGFVDVGIKTWNYGSGFPKSLDVSRAIGKRAGGDIEARKAIKWVREERERQGLSRKQLEVSIFGRSDGNVRNWEEGISLPVPGLWPRIRDALGHSSSPFDAVMLRGDEEVGTEEGSFGYQPEGPRWEKTRTLREPTTDAAKAWSGWGTALKPSWEPVIVGRKPE